MTTVKNQTRKVLAVILAALMCLGMVSVLGMAVPAADAAAVTPGAYPYKITAYVDDNLTMDATMNFTLYGTANNGTGSTEVVIATLNWDKDVSKGSTYTLFEGTTENGVFPTRIHVNDDSVKYWAVCSLGFDLVLSVNGRSVAMSATLNSSDVGNGEVSVSGGTTAHFYVKTNSAVKTNKWDADYRATDLPTPTTISYLAGTDDITAPAQGSANVTSDAFTADVRDQYGIVWGATQTQWSVTAVDGCAISVSDATGGSTKLVVPAFTKSSKVINTTVTATCTYGSSTVTDSSVVTVRPTYCVDFDLNGGATPTGFVSTQNLVNNSTAVNYITYSIPEANQSPTRTGYQFYGWSTNKSADSGEKQTLKLGYYDTYYAIWSPNSYQVYFFGNGSTSGSMAYQTMTYGFDANLRTNAFKKAYAVSFHYYDSDAKTDSAIVATETATSTFNGWARSATGSVVYTDGQSVKNLTNLQNSQVYLYANWTDGSVVLPTATKAGYSFGGWYSDKECTVKVGDAGDTYTPTAETTLYANFGCTHSKERVETVVDEPTCTTAGKNVFTCPDCGDTITVTVPALGHDYGEWIYSQSTDTHSKVCSRDATHVETEPCTYTSEVIKAATCSETGTMKYTCTVCGGTYTETIAKLAHTPKAAVTENEKAATCTATGSYDTVIYCDVCGEEISRVTTTTDMIAHTLVEIPAVEAVNCKTQGYSAGEKCSVCGLVTVAPVATGYGAHQPVDVKGTAATCTTTGWTDGTKCSVCGVTLTAQQEIALADHTPGEAVQESVIPATCKADGSYYSVVYCTVCGEELSSEKVVIPKGAHTPEVIPAVVATDCQTEGFSEGSKCSVCGEIITAPVSTGYGAHNYQTVNAKKATCTSKGYTGDVVCSLCGDVQSKGEAIPMVDHEFVTSPGYGSTCTRHGYSDAIVCINCGYEKQSHEELPLAAHTAGTVTKENEKAATCTTQGSYEEVTVCKVCNSEMSRVTVYTGYADHTAGTAVTENVKAGTCVKKGTCDKVVYCTVCGKELSRTTVETTYGDHTAGEAKQENYSAPTCTSTGVYDEVVYCSLCGKELSRTIKTVAKTSHKDSNGDGLCDACGYDLSTNCSHLCHKTGFLGFIWKIVNLFNKLFKINQYCSCGKAHW